MMTAPRIFFAMAEDRVFPKAIARVDPRTGAPTGAIVLAGCLGAVFVLVRKFTELADQFIIGIWPFYALAVAAVFVLRRRPPAAERRYRTWGYPVVPAPVILGALVGVIPLRSTAAQVVTSAAVLGKIADDAGEPIPSASLTLTNTSTGVRYMARSAGDGRFFFENVQVGGPYVLEARALGHEPGRVPDITLILGQRRVADVTLRRAAVQVGGVTVEAQADPLRSPARTGASQYVSDSLVARLPTLARNFTDLVETPPQIARTSAAGQNNRFNNIQIDGAVNNDLFGLGSTGQPGGQVNAKTDRKSTRLNSSH